MSKVSCWVLAGHRNHVDPICSHYNVKYKSLVHIQGKPLILYPLDALNQCGAVDSVQVIAQEPEKLEEALTAEVKGLETPVTFEKNNAAIANTLIERLERPETTYPVLVTTADNCLLGADDVQEFIEKANKSDATVAIGFVSKENMMTRFPSAKRTWMSFADHALSGCNLILIKDDRALKALKIWRAMEQNRKNVLKMTWSVGIKFFWQYFRQKWTMDEAFAAASKKIKCTIAPILMSNPLVSIDADKLVDIEQIEEILKGGGK